MLNIFKKNIKIIKKKKLLQKKCMAPIGLVDEAAFQTEEMLFFYKLYFLTISFNINFFFVVC